MYWNQRLILLSPRCRGCHLITGEVVKAIGELDRLEVGLLHLFLQHTSASISLNENADPDVRQDLEMALDQICPESLPYVHTCEGPDDMPAHVKSSLVGADLTIPIRQGKLALGTWQGIYLFEHRDRGSARRIVATISGIERPA